MKKAILLIAAVLALNLLTFGRAADTPTVTGKWHFVFDTQGGDRDFNSVFEQSGDQVSGKWAVADGKPGDTVKGTFIDGQLLLDFPMVSDEVGPGSLKLKGKFAADGSLTGDWAFQDYSGSFKATRLKDEPAK